MASWNGTATGDCSIYPPPNKEISDGNSGWKAAESRELPQDRQWRDVDPDLAYEAAAK